MAGTAFSTASWHGYAVATGSAARAAHTDYTQFIEIAQLVSDEPDWASAVQSDGGDIRCTDTSNNEVPFDVIDWDYNGGSPTGVIAVKLTVGTGGGTPIRVWAGYNPGTAVAYDANETYGSDNAYDSTHACYLPKGRGTDRTSNGNDTTDTGSPADTAGQLGLATNFDNATVGGTATKYADTGIDPDSSYKAFLIWTSMNTVKDDNTGTFAICGCNDGSSHRFYVGGGNGSGTSNFTDAAGGWGNDFEPSDNDEIQADEWHQIVMHFDGDDLQVRLDDANVTSDPSSSFSGTSTASITIGGVNTGSSVTNAMDAKVQHCIIYTADKGANWYDDVYDMINDNATWWGTWAWTEVNAPGSVTPFIIGGGVGSVFIAA